MSIEQLTLSIINVLFVFALIFIALKIIGWFRIRAELNDERRATEFYNDYLKELETPGDGVTDRGGA